MPHDSWPCFGRLKHVQTDAFNRQNRTIGASETDAIDDPNETSSLINV